MEGSTAFSIDGRRFEFTAPLTGPLPVGGYVELRTPVGGRYLGQITDERAERTADRTPFLAGEGLIRATIDDGGSVVRGPGSVFAEATVLPADADAVAAHLDEPWPGEAALEIGRVRSTRRPVPALLRAGGFNRHTFLCGQSGSGKTYALGVMLEQLLLQTDLRIGVLDPNSDFVHLGGIRPASDMGVSDDAHAGVAARLAEMRDRIHVIGAGRRTELRVRFSRLSFRQRTTVLQLDPIGDAGEFSVAHRIMTEFGDSDYDVRDVRERAGALDEPAAERLKLRIDNLRLAEATIWAAPEQSAVNDLADEDWRAVVFDLGGLDSAQERSILAAGVVSRLWAQRRERNPILLVIDEAHNVCPQDPTDPNQALATDHLIAIAGEGRKFGIYLLLATQRPDKLHQNVLSQCDNLLLMKMNSAADIHGLKTAFSYVPPALIEQSASFQLGEGLAAGRIVADPLLFRTGTRFTPEGGADVPTTWAQGAGR